MLLILVIWLLGAIVFCLAVFKGISGYALVIGLTWPIMLVFEITLQTLSFIKGIGEKKYRY